MNNQTFCSVSLRILQLGSTSESRVSDGRIIPPLSYTVLPKYMTNTWVYYGENTFATSDVIDA